jgi:hypothetical protein
MKFKVNLTLGNDRTDPGIKTSWVSIGKHQHISLGLLIAEMVLAAADFAQNTGLSPDEVASKIEKA